MAVSDVESLFGMRRALIKTTSSSSRVMELAGNAKLTSDLRICEWQTRGSGQLQQLLLRTESPPSIQKQPNVMK